MNKQNTPAHDAPKPKGGSPVPSKDNPPADKENKACYCFHKPPHWGWRLLEGTALVAAIVYAVVTTFMWRDSHNNFVVDERAWMNVESTSPAQSDIRDGTPIKEFIAIGNTGKTAAKRVRVAFRVSIPHNNDSVAFDYTGNISANFAGLITPNSYAQSSVDETDSEGRPRLLTQVEADDLLNGRRYMAVYGMGQYYDIFGNPHWFHFCQWKGYLTGESFNASQCVNYNDTGDGKLLDQH